ncbi:MAG: hypothetical protein ACP5VR_10990 [Acidimicrobiales bacterium]
MTALSRAGSPPDDAAQRDAARQGGATVVGPLARARVMAALTAVFNLLALNLALVVVSLPVVTIPLALNAATGALGRWRSEGEDRVVREFFAALRSGRAWQTTIRVGAPLAAIGIGVEEVHYFAHGGGPLEWTCLGFGASGLVIALSSLGYVLVLGTQDPDGAASQVWALAIALAVRNLFTTGVLFVLETTAAALAALLDAPLLLLGLPVALLWSMRLTANFGLRRAGLGQFALHAGQVLASPRQVPPSSSEVG